MATVLDIITDALIEIGAYGVGDSVTAEDAALALRRFQNQIDAWQADQITLSLQSYVSIAWPSSTSTQTIGPGGNVNIQRPVWIETLNYVIPGTNPGVEVVMGAMDYDSYAAQSIKSLQSALPIQYFYQTNIDTVLGTLFLWPQPSQSLTLRLYAPIGVNVPVGLTDVMIGPPGYQDAFMYQLALRLLTPFSRKVSDVPLLPQMAADAFKVMKRPNIKPGLLGVDPALAASGGFGYNVYSDTTTGQSR
jgi:hypothetical protein